MGSAVRILTLLLLNLLLLPLMLCLALDSISGNQQLKDGQTVISTGGTFELGFFSPNGSGARYVGIWYKRLPVEKVVWVANAETPLTDTSGVVTIGNDGNLVIVSGNNSKVWSTEAANLSTASNNTVAVLLDSGNLLLKENQSTGKVLWQSFDHLTDTYLPQMKLGLNTGKQIYIRSWKNDMDPSPGNYVVMVDPQDVPEVVFKNGSVKYWRSGQWNGRMFIGLPNMPRDFRTGFQLTVDNQGETMYFTYSTFNGTFPGLFYINPSGNGIYEEWDFNKNEWSKRQLAPIGPCDTYTSCGSFGKCNSGTSPICECLKGYQPTSVNEWENGKWENGCTRIQKYQCERNESSENGNADGFFELNGIKLPDFAHYVNTRDRGECESLCLRNCSCTAYSYAEGIGCLSWVKDLVDLQEFPFGGDRLFLKLAYSELGGKTKVRNFVRVLIIIGGILVMGFMTYILLTWKTKLKVCWKGFKDTTKRRKGAIISGDSVAGYLRRDGKDSDVPFFNLHTIEVATHHFSNANKLGQGGFGPVYKGKLPDGQEIAVKRLSRTSGQGIEEFKNEVILISKLQHRNLVRLLGFCIQGEEKLLVYEYMPNKSLDSFIFGPDSKGETMLTWDQRSTVIEGIARGLLYLHHDSRLKIIHRDLKTSNILLDYEMNPKISDFGMARIFGGNQMMANTTRVVGTYGYMSPEYAMQGMFSEKSDVFSFGILLLEIVSGKRNTSFYHYEESLNLSGHAWQLWMEGKEIELLDPRLSSSYNQTQVIRCINIGLLCVQDHPDDRPIMATIVSMLCSDMVLPSPKQPAFSHNRIPNESIPSDPSTNSCSRNIISDTVFQGR